MCEYVAVVWFRLKYSKIAQNRLKSADREETVSYESRYFQSTKLVNSDREVLVESEYSPIEVVKTDRIVQKSRIKY